MISRGSLSSIEGPTECKGLLYLYEVGASGEALDVEVKCHGVGIAAAWSGVRSQQSHDDACLPGRRPHSVTLIPTVAIKTM